jgi:dCTP diphosphatase
LVHAEQVTIEELQDLLRRFARERDWEQFHNPKNLAMALTGEVGELVEHFQWLTPSEASDVMSDVVRAREVRLELADIFSYLLRLADVLGVDIAAAVREKVALNEERYPVDLVRGRASKHSDLGGHTEGSASSSSTETAAPAGEGEGEGEGSSGLP